MMNAPTSHEAEPMDRLLHADLLAAAGRYADALRWYASIGHGAPQELPLIGFATLGMARTNERMGERATAMRDYRRLAELWRDADPPLQAIAAASAKRLSSDTAQKR